MLIYITMTELTQRLNDAEQDSGHLEMRQHHITARRYRVYIFVILTVIVLIEPLFTASIEKVRGTGAFAVSLTDPVSMHTKRGEWGKLNELDTIQADIDKAINDIAFTKLQIEIVRNLETPEKQNTILNCVNRQQCVWIEVGLLDRIDLLRSFLMIDQLTTEKLNFDQKFVLRNINEFLANQPWRGQLVTIKDITFWSPVDIVPEYKLVKVPVNMTVSYFVNNDFMTFLRNIETKIDPTLPVMWRLEAVNYNIVNYLDPQEVSLSMAFYYINQPKEDSLATGEMLSPNAESVWSWGQQDQPPAPGQ